MYRMIKIIIIALEKNLFVDCFCYYLPPGTLNQLHKQYIGPFLQYRHVDQIRNSP